MVFICLVFAVQQNLLLEFGESLSISSRNVSLSLSDWNESAFLYQILGNLTCFIEFLNVRIDNDSVIQPSLLCLISPQSSNGSSAVTPPCLHSTRPLLLFAWWSSQTSSRPSSRTHQQWLLTLSGGRTSITGQRSSSCSGCRDWPIRPWTVAVYLDLSCELDFWNGIILWQLWSWKGTLHYMSVTCALYIANTFSNRWLVGPPFCNPLQFLNNVNNES